MRRKHEHSEHIRCDGLGGRDRRGAARGDRLQRGGGEHCPAHRWRVKRRCITHNRAESPHLLGRRDRHLPAGVYQLDLAALDTTPAGRAHLPKIAVTLPSGWQGYQGFAVTKDRGLTGVMGLSFWDVDQVYGTPCTWKSKGMVDPGTTIGGLAAALSRQPLRNATAPTNFVLAGALGKYVRLSVPRHIDFAHCDKGYFESWTGLGWARDRWEQGPGQVDRVWILNVLGQRLVVDANYLPSATRADRAELDRVVHSIRFLRGWGVRNRL